MKKIENLFLHAEKMTNVFVSSNGFYSMKGPQGSLLFSPDDKLLTQKADDVRTWPPHFYGISENGFFSLYKTSGKSLLKDVPKIDITQGFATHHFENPLQKTTPIKVSIWNNGWYSINQNDNLTLYNENDEVLFEYIEEAKEFDNGHYAIKNVEGWNLYSTNNEILTKKASDLIVNKSLYAFKQYGLWNLNHIDGELIKGNLTKVNLWDNGYYAFPDDNVWKLYKQNGRLLACQALEFLVYKNGFFGSRRQSGALWFCYPDGAIITTKATVISDIYDNVFLVEKGNRYCLYNLKGKIIAENPSYIKVGKDGIYAVKKSKFWNIYDLHGKLLSSSVLDVNFFDSECYSVQPFDGWWKAITPQGEISTSRMMRIELCKDGYYIGYYEPFQRALYSPKRELLFEDLNTVLSLGNQQFLLKDAVNDFLFFIDLSKDCLAYFQNLLKQMEQKKIPLTAIQKEYAEKYIEFLTRK